MRVVGDELGPLLGGSVVVEGRPGAAGNIGARACAEAPPDGYTFCILPGETITINPHVMKDTGLDPKKSLMPVTKAFVLIQVFAVNADLGVKNFDELASLAKAKPKTLVYMAPSISKVAFMEEFNKKHGVDFVRVPFKGGGDAINAMMTGTAPIAIFGIGNLRSLMDAKKVLGFAVDSDERWPLRPTSRRSVRSATRITLSPRRSASMRRPERPRPSSTGSTRVSPRSRPTPSSRRST